MKAILMSIQPKWCELIFNGRKTIEVRKSFPKQLETPFEVVVYKTRHKGGRKIVNDCLDTVYGSGKVIGSFVCDKKYNIFCWGIGVAVTNEKNEIMPADILRKGSCLSDDEICDYVGNGEAYGWHITEPKLFEKPKDISEFGRYETKYRIINRGIETIIEDYKKFRPLRCPPQSWYYVEGGDRE